MLVVNTYSIASTFLINNSRISIQIIMYVYSFPAQINILLIYQSLLSIIQAMHPC